MGIFSNPLIFYSFVAVLFLISAPVLWYLRSSKSKSSSDGRHFGLLSKYSRDLTVLAKTGKLDPVIGREKEIARVIQILSRRTKNNPVLIGAAGVGKTAIVEGLALAIIDRKVPPALFKKRVLALDLPGLLAGTKYRGEFEERLKKITDEIVAAQRVVILFIDEIHILAEAGEAEGAINAADILKPLLARGELQVVGATTKEEYKKYIKEDKTLDRRLQPIFVSEPSARETKLILEGVKAIYEDYHQVQITAGAIKAAIALTKKIKNRSYPDKAIDALDEASSSVHLSNLSAKTKARLKVTEKEIRQAVRQWEKQ
jgi:ATP-dependent Clp protease ATP-binding subunit ClpC